MSNIHKAPFNYAQTRLIDIDEIHKSNENYSCWTIICQTGKHPRRQESLESFNLFYSHKSKSMDGWEYDDDIFFLMSNWNSLKHPRDPSWTPPISFHLNNASNINNLPIFLIKIKKFRSSGNTSNFIATSITHNYS